MSLQHLSIDNLRDLEFILDSTPERDKTRMVEHLKGAGFTSDAIKRVRNWFSLPLKFSNTSLNTLTKYGDWDIIALQIYRRPLSKMLLGTLNAISTGRFYPAMKQFGFDKFFHLSLVATVSNGKSSRNIIMEKNEVVNISPNFKSYDDTEVYPVSKHCKIPLIDFVEKALKTQGKEKFFTYDAFTNNCQFFIRYLLKANCNLYSVPVEKFLFQNVAGLLKSLPSYIRPFAKGVTNIAAVASKLTGKGVVEQSEKELEKQFKTMMKSYGKTGGKFVNFKDKLGLSWLEKIVPE